MTKLQQSIPHNIFFGSVKISQVTVVVVGEDYTDPWTRCWSNQQLVIDYRRILIVSRVCVPPLIRILFRFSFSHNIQIFCAGYTLLESLALSCPGILFSAQRNKGSAVKIHCCGIALLKQRINLSSC